MYVERERVTTIIAFFHFIFTRIIDNFYSHNIVLYLVIQFISVSFVAGAKLELYSSFVENFDNNYDLGSASPH